MYERFVLAVVLVAGAGCGGLAPTDQETVTVTSAPVPEVSGEQTANQLPPGVTGADVADVDRLARAHRRALRGLAYTWRDESLTVTTFSNDSIRSEVTRSAHVENETRYDYWTNRQAVDGEPFSYLGNYTEYSDVTGRYVRFVDNGAVAYARRPARSATDRLAPMATSAIRQYLTVENATVAVTLVDGERYYEISASEYGFPAATAITNFSVRAVVSPAGFVRSLNASYVRSQGTELQRVTYEYRYTKVGATDVERPPWVGIQWPGATPGE